MMKFRFQSWALLTSVTACTLFVGGCSTPQSRISDHPDLYNGLPARQQQLVTQGQIAPGMSKNAVWLAWGAPEQKVNGYARGTATETWIYYTTTTYPGYGYGYPYGYGRFGYGPYGYGFGPGFWGGGVAVFRTHHGHRFAVFGDPFYDPFFYSYLPPTVQYPYKMVTFVNGRTVSFQTMVGGYY
jgi:hypothetical protein